jgi:hypothetical protein
VDTFAVATFETEDTEDDAADETDDSEDEATDTTDEADLETTDDAEEATELTDDTDALALEVTMEAVDLTAPAARFAFVPVLSSVTRSQICATCGSTNLRRWTARRATTSPRISLMRSQSGAAYGLAAT